MKKWKPFLLTAASIVVIGFSTYAYQSNGDSEGDTDNILTKEMENVVTQTFHLKDVIKEDSKINVFSSERLELVSNISSIEVERNSINFKESNTDYSYVEIMELEEGKKNVIEYNVYLTAADKEKYKIN